MHKGIDFNKLTEICVKVVGRWDHWYDTIFIRLSLVPLVKLARGLD